MGSHLPQVVGPPADPLANAFRAEQHRSVTGHQYLDDHLREPAQRSLQRDAVAITYGGHDASDDCVATEKHAALFDIRADAVLAVSWCVKEPHSLITEVDAERPIKGGSGPEDPSLYLRERLARALCPPSKLAANHPGSERVGVDLGSLEGLPAQNVIPVAMCEGQAVWLPPLRADEIRHGLSLIRVVARIDGQHRALANGNAALPLDKTIADGKDTGSDFGKHGASSVCCRRSDRCRHPGGHPSPSRPEGV